MAAADDKKKEVKNWDFFGIASGIGNERGKTGVVFREMWAKCEWKSCAAAAAGKGHGKRGSSRSEPTNIPPEIPPKLTHTHSHTWPASHTHETKTAVALNVTFYLCTRSNFQPSNRRKPPSPGPSFSATICKKWAENRFYPLEMRFRFIFAPGDRTDSYFTQVMYTTVLYSTGWAIISCLIRKWSMVLGGALKGR